MHRTLLIVALLTSGYASAQYCPGTIEYMSAYGPCSQIVQPQFVGRIAIEGSDTSWYSEPSTGTQTVWAKVSSGWIEYMNDDSCARERIVKYRPCDPTKPDTLTFLAFTNTNKNFVQAVDWKRATQIRFTNLRITKLPPDYQRIAYLVNDNTGVRFMPDGRWKMPTPANTYCTQFPAASTWLQAGVIPVATITFPAPVDIAYFLGKTSSGAALQFEAETMQVLVMP